MTARDFVNLVLTIRAIYRRRERFFRSVTWLTVDGVTWEVGRD